MKYLCVGDVVLVHIPESDRPFHSPIAKYHGKEMVVSARKLVGRSSKAYYKLSGAKSDYGIHYSFVDDWLIPIEK